MSVAGRAQGTGLTGQYYDTATFGTLKTTRTDAAVEFRLGHGDPRGHDDHECGHVFRRVVGADRAGVFGALHVLRHGGRWGAAVGERSDDGDAHVFRDADGDARADAAAGGAAGEYPAGIHRADRRRVGEAGVVVGVAGAGGDSDGAALSGAGGQGGRLAVEGALERHRGRGDLVAHVECELPEQAGRSRVHHVVRVSGAGLGGLVWHARHGLHRAAGHGQLHLRGERR